jgi:Fe-S-cluster containining protein
MKEILEQYGTLMEDLDKKCAEVDSRAPEIPCKNKCFDCCKQLFPVSFAEAFYISEGLKKMDRALRRKRIRVAEKIAEKIRAKNPWQFERKAVDRKTALNTHAEFAKFLHEIESDCPALDPKNPAGACTVYSFRNHDCRSMGFSFDRSENVIVGCFRFAKLGHLIPKLMDFGYRYPEKMALDRELISEITAGAFTPNILYYTTMCGPLIKDYAAEDWLKFFLEKGVPAQAGADGYWVVIDV